MAQAQPGIFALGTRSHYHLELRCRPGTDAAALVDALRAVREPAVTAGGANVVIGFGADLWREIAPSGTVPDGLAAFAAIDGLDGHHAPATQGDLWIWANGTGDDVVLDVARGVMAALDPVAELVLDQRCFTYKDSRDLTGFVDGTANPPIERAHEVACVAADRPGAGGSFAITQRWVHDLAAFHALDVDEQQRVVGRTKADSIELDGDDKPATAHIARAETDGPDGDELEIYRRSTPFGTVGEQGLYFVGFSADLGRFDAMLARIFGTSGDGLRDHLLDFTTAVTGSYWFVPGLDALHELIGDVDDED